MIFRKMLCVTTILILTLIAQVISASETPETKTINGIECVLVSGKNEIFYISKYEITQAQYKQVMGNNPSKFVGDSLPVETVTWNDAVEFCKKVGGILPTEEQWTIAAAGGNLEQNAYEYSGSNNPDEVGWYWNNSGNKTHLVGQKKANGLGIYDMSGNVWEWTSTGINDSYRTIKGGGWNDDTESGQIVNRFSNFPTSKDYSLGFRIVFLKVIKKEFQSAAMSSAVE